MRRWFFCVGRQRYVTGQTLLVDGGFPLERRERWCRQCRRPPLCIREVDRVRAVRSNEEGEPCEDFWRREHLRRPLSLSLDYLRVRRRLRRRSLYRFIS